MGSLQRPEASLEDRWNAVGEPVVMTGIQALVRLPLLRRQMDAALGWNTKSRFEVSHATYSLSSDSSPGSSVGTSKCPACPAFSIQDSVSGPADSMRTPASEASARGQASSSNCRLTPLKIANSYETGSMPPPSPLTSTREGAPLGSSRGSKADSAAIRRRWDHTVVLAL